MAKFLDSTGLAYFKGKILTLLSNKVDKVSGKGLSTNDFTADAKSKLDGIAENANNYTLPTASASTLGGVKVGANLSISDGVLNAKNTEYSTASGSASGLMSSADKAKLDGIAANANNYSLPTASTSTLGGVKVGTNLSITNGVLSAKNTEYSTATGSASGLMSSTDKAKLDAFSAASAYALKTDIASMYKYKGSKATYADLPTTGNTAGDVWNVEANEMNYAWTGSAWDSLGGIFSIDAITNTEIDSMFT